MTIAVVIPAKGKMPSGRPGGVVRWSTTGGRTIRAFPPTGPASSFRLIVAVERAIRQKMRGRPRTIEAEVWAVLTSFEGAYTTGIDSISGDSRELPPPAPGSLAPDAHEGDENGCSTGA